jgi:hypothetical protein
MLSRAIAAAALLAIGIFGLAAGCGDRAIVGDPDPEPDPSLSIPVLPGDSGTTDSAAGD